MNNLRNQVGFADALNLGQQLSSCVGLIAETDVNGVVALVWHGLGVLGGSPLGPMMEVSTQPPAERTDHEIRKHPLPARRRLACQRVWSFHERIGSGRETFRRPACREQHPNLCLGNHAATRSFSSGQINCQSSGRNSCLVTICLVHCSMATHTFSSKVRLPYATLVRWRAVVPTLSANAWRSCGGISKRYFLSSMAVLYTTWCTALKLFGVFRDVHYRHE